MSYKIYVGDENGKAKYAGDTVDEALRQKIDGKLDSTTASTTYATKTELNSKANSSDLATVATSGSYTDLSNRPTIPAAQVPADWNATTGVARILNKPTIPTKTSQLTNDSGFLTEHQDISGKANSADLATVATSGSYNDLSNKPTIPAAQVNSDWNAASGKAQILNKPTTVTGYGITDVYTKTEVDGKLAGAMHFKGTVTSASALPTSGNTQGDMYNVQDTGANYAWDGSAWDKLSENIDISGKQDKLVSGTNIKTVNNTSLLGSGNIVIDSLPTQTNNSGKYLTTDGTSASWNSLANVATSGSYADLSNKPTIGNGTLTIQKNGVDVATFTANQTGNITANIEVESGGVDASYDSENKRLILS